MTQFDEIARGRKEILDVMPRLDLMTLKCITAVGRKEILELTHAVSWRSIQKHKKDDPGFRKIIKKHPINGKPMIIVFEYVGWIIEFNNK